MHIHSDRRERDGCHLVRVRVLPRKSLFLPQYTCPVDVRHLRADCKVEQKLEDGSSHVMHTSWTRKQKMPHMWTGRTVFTIASSGPCSQVESSHFAQSSSCLLEGNLCLQESSACTHVQTLPSLFIPQPSSSFFTCNLRTSVAILGEPTSEGISTTAPVVASATAPVVASATAPVVCSTANRGAFCDVWSAGARSAPVDRQFID